MQSGEWGGMWEEIALTDLKVHFHLPVQKEKSNKIHPWVGGPRLGLEPNTFTKQVTRISLVYEIV
jgi:hypothetical protein